jgi:hypothetical protein
MLEHARALVRHKVFANDRLLIAVKHHPDAGRGGTGRCAR